MAKIEEWHVFWLLILRKRVDATPNLQVEMLGDKEHFHRQQYNGYTLRFRRLFGSQSLSDRIAALSDAQFLV